MKQDVAPGIRTETAWIVASIALIFAAFPRILAARGVLWFDEIFSLNLLEHARHIWDVFRIHHDNNHILLSMYLYVLGGGHSAMTYRLLSIASGSLSVVLMGIINLRHGLRSVIITMVLGAFSYPLILYSSEARGFAPAVFFALLSYYLMGKCLQRDSYATAALFWASSAAGVLAHLSFVFVYLSLVIWSFFRLIRLNGERRTMLVAFARYHLVPTLFMALLYFFHVRRLVYGGRTPRELLDLLAEIFYLLSGAPSYGETARIVGIVLGVAGLLSGLIYLYRDKSDEWIFFLFQLIVAPGLIYITALVVSKSHSLWPRYFITCFPFYYIMIGRSMAWCLDRGKAWALLLVVAPMIFFLGGSIQKTLAQIEIGRGDYRTAVEYMAKETQGPDIVVGSDHDLRNQTLLEFYARFLPKGKKLSYVDRGSWRTEAPPEWFIIHSLRADFTPMETIRLWDGTSYRLARHFPFFGLSGWHWAVYHRI